MGDGGGLIVVDDGAVVTLGRLGNSNFEVSLVAACLSQERRLE